MKKTTLFAALVSMIAINATAQNVWDGGASIPTTTVNGKVAIGTATPTNGYSLTVRNTSNTQSHGILNEVINSYSADQYGIRNTTTYSGTTGIKVGYNQVFSSNSAADNYGMFLSTNASAFGNRFGFVSTIGNNTKTDCAIYSAVGPPGIGTPVTLAGDRSGFFIGAFEVVARTNEEKIFIINNRNFSQAGFGTDVFRILGNGTVYATEVNVMVTPFPDYVFSPSHKLMSLFELKNYISENKHLPNIPPASEVEQNGLNLGEMNVKLVEKIEELTLYILQQQEQIDLLKLEVENLKH